MFWARLGPFRGALRHIVRIYGFEGDASAQGEVFTRIRESSSCRGVDAGPDSAAEARSGYPELDGRALGARLYLIYIETANAAVITGSASNAREEYSKDPHETSHRGRTCFGACVGSHSCRKSSVWRRSVSKGDEESSRPLLPTLPPPSGPC